jgi:hypothetical protein
LIGSHRKGCPMLPEEQELMRFDEQQKGLEERLASTELELESISAEIERFMHRYYHSVGALYAELDALDAQAYAEQLKQTPNDPTLQAQAKTSEERAKRSAEEAGLASNDPTPTPEITLELKQAYRRAVKLLHPDLSLDEGERLRRTALMAQINLAYERGDLGAIEKLIQERRGPRVDCWRRRSVTYRQGDTSDRTTATQDRRSWAGTGSIEEDRIIRLEADDRRAGSEWRRSSRRLGSPPRCADYRKKSETCTLKSGPVAPDDLCGLYEAELAGWLHPRNGVDGASLRRSANHPPPAGSSDRKASGAAVAAMGPEAGCSVSHSLASHAAGKDRTDGPADSQ